MSLGCLPELICLASIIAVAASTALAIWIRPVDACRCGRRQMKGTEVISMRPQNLLTRWYLSGALWPTWIIGGQQSVGWHYADHHSICRLLL